MNKYQDRDSYWHDRECIDGEPSSNNRLTYTAYSKYLTPKASQEELLLRRLAFQKCEVSDVPPIKINRLANKPFPPFSKDEVIGAISQGFINAKQLEDSHWNFCNLPEYTPEKLTFKKAYKAAKILWKIRKEHRNYVWENKLEDAYCLTFWLQPWDQYYVKKFCGEDATLLQTIFFYLNAINVLTKGGKSVRMMLWLQCEDLNHWLLKFINVKKWVEDYFEENHPFKENL